MKLSLEVPPPKMTRFVILTHEEGPDMLATCARDCARECQSRKFGCTSKRVQSSGACDKPDLVTFKMLLPFLVFAPPILVHRPTCMGERPSRPSPAGCIAVIPWPRAARSDEGFGCTSLRFGSEPLHLFSHPWFPGACE